VRFRDIRHQDRAVAMLQRSLRRGRLAHALLLAGPEGVGKELAARALAARLLCHQPPDDEPEPCGACESCRLLASGNHPDFHLIHRGLHRQHPDRTIRESKGLSLVVDVVRHFLIEPAQTSPSLGRRRVFVVRDAERLNEAAQNALLKTLEEPPPSVTLVLVTASAGRLLPTIRSRCQLISFDPLPTAFIADELSRQLDVPPEDARALAELSGGRLGVALRWCRAGLSERIGTIGQILLRADPLDPEAAAKSLLEEAQQLAIDLRAADDDSPARTGRVETDELRDALHIVLRVAAMLLRDALHSAAGLEPRVTDAVHARRLAGGADVERLLVRIEAIQHAGEMIDRNVAPQLAMEALAIALTDGRR